MATDHKQTEPLQNTSETIPNPTKAETSKTESIIKPFTKKNWDAILDEYEKEEQESQGVDNLFKQLYEAGSDEVKRAMNKSYSESGGTVLSTNWENVAHKKVEPKPPSDHDDKPKDSFEDNLLQ